MTPHALIFTLAAIGISVTAYLIRKKVAQERPACIIGQECHQVLESTYNKTLGIPNEILGLVFYVVITLITAFLVIGIGPATWWDILAKIIIFSGAILSTWFIYVQWRIIKVWCFWCVMSATIVYIMAIIILTNDLMLLP